MITLTILCMIYTIVGLIILKKQYGTIDLPYDAPLWAIALIFTSAFVLASIIIAIIKYLP